MTVRISLDVSPGTFIQLEAVCNEEFQNKASYLRQLIDQDMAKRRGESDEKG